MSAVAKGSSGSHLDFAKSKLQLLPELGLWLLKPPGPFQRRVLADLVDPGCRMPWIGEDARQVFLALAEFTLERAYAISQSVE